MGVGTSFYVRAPSFGRILTNTPSFTGIKSATLLKIETSKIISLYLLKIHVNFTKISEYEEDMMRIINSFWKIGGRVLVFELVVPKCGGVNEKTRQKPIKAHKAPLFMVGALNHAIILSKPMSFLQKFLRRNKIWCAFENHFEK